MTFLNFKLHIFTPIFSQEFLTDECAQKSLLCLGYSPEGLYLGWKVRKDSEASHWLFSDFLNSSWATAPPGVPKTNTNLYGRRPRNKTGGQAAQGRFKAAHTC